jgi:hypothetical protein
MPNATADLSQLHDTPPAPHSRISEQSYRRFVELSAEGIWVVDSELKTTFVNCRLSEMLGYSVEEIIGRSPFELPCDPDSLKRTVTRAIESQDLLGDPTLRQLVSQMRSVPSLPSLYLEILDALKDPDCSLPRIGSIISRDAGMTAKILQLANSAFFGLTRQTFTPSDAIFHLGLETVQALALGVGVFSSFHSAPLRTLGLQGLWEHSVATGALAKKIARQQTRDNAVIDAAFTGGLLHDLGKLVLAAGVAAEYGEALERARHDGTRSSRLKGTAWEPPTPPLAPT